MKDTLALPSDRAVAATPSSPTVSPVPASIPSAGDTVIIEHPYLYDQHIVARVVKAGKVMWEVQARGRGGWSGSVRRKVLSWLPICAEHDPDKLADQLRNAADRLRTAERQVKDQYLDRVKRIAQGIAARSDETQSGSAEGKSPVATPCAQEAQP